MSNPTLLDTSQIQYAVWRAFLVATTPNPQVAPGPWRPPGWSQKPPSTFIEDEEGNLWYFDAVFRNEHMHSQKITQHPLQDKASIVDHSFSLPAQLTLEIGMSDSMDSYTPSQWGDGDSIPSRSVNAYQKLLLWKSYGTPLNITTRLYEYTNMVVQYVSAPDTKETQFGLRCTVSFQQVFVARTAITKTTIRPMVVNETKKGSQSTTSIEQAPDMVELIFNGIRRL